MKKITGVKRTDDVSMEELYFMEDFKSINEAWFREADDEADEMFLAYECGPETWRIDKNESIIANCLTLPHNEKEMVRKDSLDKSFNYNW